VVQAYLHRSSALQRPEQVLCGFAKIDLEPGGSARVRLPVSADSLREWDDRLRRWRHLTGPVEIRVGSSSRDIRQRALVELATVGGVT
jgi:beta-glucosidase